jgi:hypothetical protein
MGAAGLPSFRSWSARKGAWIHRSRGLRRASGRRGSIGAWPVVACGGHPSTTRQSRRSRVARRPAGTPPRVRDQRWNARQPRATAWAVEGRRALPTRQRRGGSLAATALPPGRLPPSQTTHPADQRPRRVRHGASPSTLDALTRAPLPRSRSGRPGGGRGEPPPAIDRGHAPTGRRPGWQGQALPPRGQQPRRPRRPGTPALCANARSRGATRRASRSTRPWTRGPHAVGPAKGVWSRSGTTPARTRRSTGRWRSRQARLSAPP